jgi:cytochrome c oxidase cbb3-type subunit 3
MKRVAVLTGIWIALALVSNKPIARTPEAIAAKESEAKTTFTRVCASCHGLDGRGGERGPDIVARPDVVGKTDAELMGILQQGKIAAGMPSFASQGSARLSALVAYLRLLQGSKKETKLPGDAERGKALFFGAAQCSTCHMVGGRGGFIGAELSVYATRIGADEVRAAIVDPNKDLDPRRGLVTITLADSTTLAGLVRNQDNFSLQLQTPDGVFHLLNKSDIRTTKYEGKSMMPSDYGSKLSKEEINDLVSFLLRTSGSHNRQTPAKVLQDGEEE